MAIVRCLTKAKHMVWESPHPVIIYTDHHNLLKTFSSDNNNRGRTASWLDKMGSYDFVVEHRPNTLKIIRIADGMSRLTGPICEPDIRTELEPLPFSSSSALRAEVYRRSGGREPKNPVTFISALPFSSETVVREDEELPNLIKDYGNDLWYKDIIPFLLKGPLGITHLDRNQKRSVVRRSARYRIVEGSLCYMEKDGIMAACILHSEVQTALEWAHETSGHYAVALTLRNLWGYFWWPNRHSDVVTHCFKCTACAVAG